MTTMERNRETSRPGAAASGPPSGRGSGAGTTAGTEDGAHSTLPHADDLVAELMPEEVDWENLVRSYPLPALAIAAAAGFYLGIKRGPLLVGAFTGWATGQLAQKVNGLFEQDLL